MKYIDNYNNVAYDDCRSSKSRTERWAWKRGFRTMFMVQVMHDEGVLRILRAIRCVKNPEQNQAEYDSSLALLEKCGVKPEKYEERALEQEIVVLERFLSIKKVLARS